MGIFGFGVDDASGAAQGMADAGKDLAKKVLPALKNGIQMAVDMFQRLADYLGQEAFKTDGAFDISKLFADIGQKIKSAIFSALLKGIPMLMGAYWHIVPVRQY